MTILLAYLLLNLPVKKKLKIGQRFAKLWTIIIMDCFLTHSVDYRQKKSASSISKIV